MVGQHTSATDCQHRVDLLFRRIVLLRARHLRFLLQSAVQAPNESAKVMGIPVRRDQLLIQFHAVN